MAESTKTRKRYLSDSQAWTWLRRKWEKPARDLNGDVGILIECLSDQEEIFNDGLCYCLIEMRRIGLIDSATETRMKSRISKYRLDNNILSGYLWPCNAHGARSRAAFCRRMAEETRRRSPKRITTKAKVR